MYTVCSTAQSTTLTTEKIYIDVRRKSKVLLIVNYILSDRGVQLKRARVVSLVANLPSSISAIIPPLERGRVRERLANRYTGCTRLTINARYIYILVECLCRTRTEYYVRLKLFVEAC